MLKKNINSKQLLGQPNHMSSVSIHKWWNFRFISFSVRVKHRRGLGTRREGKGEAVSVKGRRRNAWVNLCNSYVIAHGCLSTDFFPGKY